MRTLLPLVALLAPLALARAKPAPVNIVAAEAVYADIARQIAGPGAAVSSIMNNPDEDPHLFEASPSVARALAAARIAIMNGADYDPWMRTLLRATPRPDRQIIDVGEVMHAAPGANPHLWYDPPTAPSVARALSHELATIDPAHASEYQQRLDAFLASLAPLDAKIAQMRRAFTGTPVTATEPVFGYMAAALGLVVRNPRFQLAVMNDTEPSARDVAAFEHDLRSRTVRVLLYNNQTTDNLTRRMQQIAQQSGVPIVGVAETLPAGKTYQQWMLDDLTALDAALARPHG